MTVDIWIRDYNPLIILQGVSRRKSLAGVNIMSFKTCWIHVHAHCLLGECGVDKPVIFIQINNKLGCQDWHLGGLGLNHSWSA
jgi:hypothetical protein